MNLEANIKMLDYRNLKMNKKQNWIASPTKTQAIIITLMYCVLILMILLLTTNTFSKFTFNSENVASLLLVPLAIFRIYIVWRNYLMIRKNRIADEH